MTRASRDQVIDLTARREAAADEGERIARAIAELEIEETAISAWRNYLHRRIDWLYLSAPLAPLQARELQQLEILEVAISKQRRELHDEIDVLRAKLGLPRKRIELAAAAVHDPLDVA